MFVKLIDVYDMYWSACDMCLTRPSNMILLNAVFLLFDALWFHATR